MLPPELRRKLSRLAASPTPVGWVPAEEHPRSPAPVAAQPAAASPSDAFADPCPVVFPLCCEGDDLPSMVGGRVVEMESGSFWLTEIELERAWPPGSYLWDRLRPSACGPPPDLPEMNVLQPDELAFFDIETAGLMGAVLFLVGALDLRDGTPMLRFFLARDYPEEPAVLEAFSRYVRSSKAVVTFNGKSFDMPYVVDRMRYHRLPPGQPPVHLDLLHSARRRWRGKFGNCRLVTLERELLGRHRDGDIPSHLIPETYHRFVASGDPGVIVPILQHNALDLLTLCELLSLQLATAPARLSS